MTPPTLVLGCVVVGLVLLVVLRRMLVKLVGPVLGFDAVRTARRSRLSLLRAGYAFVLLLVLFLVYVREFGLDLLLGVSFGHWLCFIVAASLCQWWGWSQLIGPLAHFHHVGLTPTVTQLHYLVPLLPPDVATPGWAEFLGVLLYAGLALGLWKLLIVRFTSVTGRR